MSLLSTPKQTHNEHRVKTEAEVNTLDHRPAAVEQAPVAISPGQTITTPTVNEPEPAAGNTTRRPPALAHLCRRLVSTRLRALCSQRLDIREVAAPRHTSPVAANGSPTEIRIHDSQFYQRLLFGGSLGAAESYLRGEWSSNDLLATMRLLVQKVQELESLDRESGHLQRPLRWALRWLHRNNLAGSRRNIAAHYDLSNQFFSLMLDPTMTYSAGLFAAPTCSMEEASLAKYKRICDQLQLTSQDRLLEIGSGWGGFAVYAAQHYGCHVTTATISEAQYEFAQARIAEAGLQEQIDLRLCDYRNLSGQYDKLVSIEMIEAVGERYLPHYFRTCSQLLAQHGMMMLQAIVIPDMRYRSYRRSVDFIQRYIFPGGFLPSFSAIGQALRDETDLRFVQCDDFGLHYAETLSRWRTKFWQNIERVRALGFDDRFIRMWHYYLCYCEAGFRERQVGVSQILLEKPGCRRSSQLDDR
ncbi:MAG TPA: SAM-dependent methyltransferase [Planctomycetaceae bacterium]|nr:SAM-dependent methyltransferase [Planctomycetaceae bacterium]